MWRELGPFEEAVEDDSGIGKSSRLNGVWSNASGIGGIRGSNMGKLYVIVGSIRLSIHELVSHIR